MFDVNFESIQIIFTVPYFVKYFISRSEKFLKGGGFSDFPHPFYSLFFFSIPPLTFRNHVYAAARATDDDNAVFYGIILFCGLCNSAVIVVYYITIRIGLGIQ